MGSETTGTTTPPGNPAHRLQELRPECQWVVADSNVLAAIARGDLPTFGKRGRRLRKLIGITSALGMSIPLLLGVGIRGLLALMAAQGGGTARVDRAARAVDTASGRYPSYFFVGFGAGSEDRLLARYLDEHPDGVGQTNQIEPSTFGKWHSVRFVQATRMLVVALRSVRAATSNLPPGFEKWRLDFLTSAGIRIAHYAFLRAWFEELLRRRTDLREVAFLAADTPAFAAVDAGLPTRYIQHGMVRHSLLLPNFEWVDALTPDEAMHFRQRLPSAEIELQQSTGMPIARATMSDGILIASVYGAPVEMQRVSSFLDWATSIGIKVWVRPHPREDRSFWRDEDIRPCVAMEDSDASFNEALARLRPRMVVSWFSTALAEALAAGILPVSVSARDDPNVRDMVYPLFRRCLHWPDDTATITRVLEDDDAYRAEIGRLRLGWEGLPE